MKRDPNDPSFKTIVVEEHPPLSDRELKILDLHSAVNIVSLFQSELRLIDQWLDAHKATAPDDSNSWFSIHQTEIERRFHDVFHAIEKNAKGAYRIRYNLARKDPKDYYFDLKFKPRAGSEHFAIPVRLMDVMRDLAANARKYTAPGGHFALNLVQDEERIEIAIEDDGCGIPEDELQRVFEFGYRASNASGRPTNGGGFGLTKAILVVHELGGQLTLASAVDAGTKIHISIPSKGHG